MREEDPPQQSNNTNGPRNDPTTTTRLHLACLLGAVEALTNLSTSNGFQKSTIKFCPNC
jgi:hypothetical protein